MSILLGILVSYTILLAFTIDSFESSQEKKIEKNLDTYLYFVRFQCLSWVNQIRHAFLFPATSPQVRSYLRQRDSRQLAAFLERSRQALPFLALAEFTDPRGMVIASLGGEKSGHPLPFTAMVEKAFKKRESVLSFELVQRSLLCRGREPCASGQTGDHVITAAVALPILDETGAPLGALTAAVPLNVDDLIPRPVGENGGHDLEAGLTLGDLRMLGVSDEALAVADANAGEIIPVLRKGRTYQGDVTIGGKGYHAAFQPLTNSRGELIGSIAVALSKEHLLAKRGDYSGAITTSAVIAGLLAFIIAFYASRRLTAPLEELARGVGCVEEGNLDYRVAIEGGGEFGMLAKSFNRMADTLRERDKTIRNKTFDLEVLNRCLHEMNELLESNVKERTAELEMEKGRLEAILSSMAEGVVVTDRDNRIILFNSAAQKIFGIAPYKVLSRQVDQIDLKGDFHQLIESIREMRTGDHLVQGEREITLNRKKLRVSLSPLLDKSWEFAGVVMSVRDVTHEEEVDRMKREFIATVSHELKTPLTSMKGSLQVILGKGEGLNDTERELIQVCLRNTDRLIRLISDILDISRIESGKVETRLKAESMEKMVAYAIEETASYARDHGVMVENAVNFELPSVLADQDGVIQVLTNLLSNAIKFSPAGKKVSVTAERENGYLKVSVHDQGKVIERSDREKLFQRFPRFASDEARERGGTGLGLAICREIIEHHHGRIFYKAGADGGNIFSFTVPVCGDE